MSGWLLSLNRKFIYLDVTEALVVRHEGFALGGLPLTTFDVSDFEVAPRRPTDLDVITVSHGVGRNFRF